MNICRTACAVGWLSVHAQVTWAARVCRRLFPISRPRRANAQARRTVAGERGRAPITLRARVALGGPLDPNWRCGDRREGRIASVSSEIRLSAHGLPGVAYLFTSGIRSGV